MRTTTIPQTIVNEEIQSFKHQVGAYVNVIVGFGSEVNGEFIFTVPQQFDNILIVDVEASPLVGREAISDYTDLMSANPSWSPNKPANTFRKEDLWHFVDLIRSRR